MSRADLEVADIFRALGPAYRARNAGHLSLGQLRVMSAIEACRTAALGGHVSRCEDCAHIDVAYNSCRNRHCPKCQAAAAYDWLEARRAELLPVAYYHAVFTLPAPIADIAFTNKAVIYNALFKAASEALLTIAADPKHLGARIGVTMVLHTWGSALTHHPHVHCIVRVEALRQLASAGFPVGQISFCRCACSRGCFGASCCNALSPRTATARSVSSVIMPILATLMRFALS